MECIRLFNAELQSLYDITPPISKQKMGSITRTAMKSIKFYKHVVQSVEKFIQKCKTEYKIPGLYVIDSIVRQSRHQFGPEKDVFAPRFARNMETTFAHLFKCPPEDKSKIIRVLNLWQKNSVFPPETVQPLFDLANPDHPLHQSQALEAANSSMDQNLQLGGAGDELASGQDNSKPLDQNTIRQLQQFQQMLMRQTGESSGVKFNKNLLDFDYGEDEEDHGGHSSSPRVPNAIPDPKSLTQILSDPNIVKHLQNIQILKQNEMESQKNTKLTEMRLQEEKFEKHLATVLKKLPFANECDLSKQSVNEYSLQSQSSLPYGMGTSAYNTLQYVQMQAEAANMPDPDPEVQFVSSNDKDEIINLDANESRSSSPRHDRYRRRRSRSRSRDRTKRDRRRRTISRSRSRSPRRSRRSREREREHEKERKRKGLPDIKKEHLSVCTTTLWVGHLSKLVQQEELSDTFGKYGDIVSIDVIPPRGCAFIVMHRRQDAYKCMQALKGYKMHNRIITVSWAAAKGVKTKEWKDYWDIDLGVSYIPWTKLSKGTNFTELEEGSMFDEETMPAWLKEKLKEQPVKEEAGEVAVPPNPLMFGVPPSIDTSQPPPATTLISGLPVVPPFPMGPVPRLITPMGIPVPMLNIPPPHMMMSNPASALMPINPFSAPPPTFNTQLFGNSVPVPTMPSTTTDDHMDIEGEEETSNVNKNMSGQDNNAQKSFNHPAMSSGGSHNRNDDRQSSRDHQNRRNSDNSDRNDRRGGGNRWNSQEREDSYERDNRRGMRQSGGSMRHDREKPLSDRLRDMAGNNRGGYRGDGGHRGGYDRDNYNQRDNRGGGRYNDNSQHQMGMQRNDFNRMDDGYDRRNFGPNRFNNNNMPMRGGRGGNQFNPRMQNNYGPRGNNFQQRYNMYDDERNNRGSDRGPDRGHDHRRRNWNDDSDDRHNNRSPPRHDRRQQNDEQNWDNEEVEERWNQNDNNNQDREQDDVAPGIENVNTETPNMENNENNYDNNDDMDMQQEMNQEINQDMQEESHHHEMHQEMQEEQNVPRNVASEDIFEDSHEQQLQQEHYVEETAGHGDNNSSNQYQEENNYAQQEQIMQENLTTITSSDEPCNNDKENVNETQEGGTTPLCDE